MKKNTLAKRNVNYSAGTVVIVVDTSNKYFIKVRALLTNTIVWENSSRLSEISIEDLTPVELRNLTATEFLEIVKEYRDRNQFIS